ncbi:sigma-70 family RNA polymerase sigma factor [Hyphomicrobium sp. D-2]|uniref:RNA polymerase sigma factor n=1 Tax=Hyphomicrobium sp. D-2 TaxID=3041621 RepID=UPI002455EAFF|nr:sigma-70 family RNA polymerase sigma factor [Hyphomicrobium sp. D-2]MDH4983709.1 sigma-70 family RNA polymerase sigma factor [Hyphomicrobium sp. D-2]
MAAKSVDLANLYSSERSRLGRLIDRIVRNPATTEDLVHDVFVRVMTGSSPEVRDERAYLSRVARNLAIDHTRKAVRTVDVSEETFFAFVDPAPSPETIAADRQALAITVGAIASLPERTRRALELHRLGDHTLESIGKQLGISTSLASRLVIEGYRIVQKRLDEAGAV